MNTVMLPLAWPQVNPFLDSEVESTSTEGLRLIMGKVCHSQGENQAAGLKMWLDFYHLQWLDVYQNFTNVLDVLGIFFMVP